MDIHPSLACEKNNQLEKNTPWLVYCYRVVALSLSLSLDGFFPLIQELNELEPSTDPYVHHCTIDSSHLIQTYGLKISLSNYKKDWNLFCCFVEIIMSLHSEEEHRARSYKQKHQSDKILWMYAWKVSNMCSSFRSASWGLTVTMLRIMYLFEAWTDCPVPFEDTNFEFYLLILPHL